MDPAEEQTEPVTDFTEQEKLLKKIHEELELILGVQNRNQQFNDLVAYNYLNKEEMENASKILSDLGVETLKRDDKECNLFFSLNFDVTQVAQIKKEKRTFEKEILVEAFCWILKKYYRKTLTEIPKFGMNNFGISLRGNVNSKITEFDSVKKRIEEKFGIVCHSQRINEKSTDFFVLIDETAIDVYRFLNGEVSTPLLFGILSDEKKLEEIQEQIIKKKLEKIENQIMEEKTENQKKGKVDKSKVLSFVLRAALNEIPEVKFNYKDMPDGTMYIQTRNISRSEVQIYFCNGSTEQKSNLIEVVKFFLKKKFEGRIKVKNSPEGTYLIVSIEGLLNKEVPKKAAKNKSKVVGLKENEESLSNEVRIALKESPTGVQLRDIQHVTDDKMYFETKYPSKKEVIIIVCHGSPEQRRKAIADVYDYLVDRYKDKKAKIKIIKTVKGAQISFKMEGYVNTTFTPVKKVKIGKIIKKKTTKAKVVSDTNKNVTPAVGGNKVWSSWSEEQQKAFRTALGIPEEKEVDWEKVLNFIGMTYFFFPKSEFASLASVASPIEEVLKVFSKK